VSQIAQKIASSASSAYRPRFGVGLDKAAVSRSLGALRAAGLVECEGEPARRGGAHALALTGLALHDRMAEAAVERERLLLTGFSGEERALLQGFVERLNQTAGQIHTGRDPFNGDLRVQP
jgi:DNA-binding MarR family transcriptional regulator